MALDLRALLTPYAMPNPTGAVEGAAGTLSALGAQNHQQSQFDSTLANRQAEFKRTADFADRGQSFAEDTNKRDYDTRELDKKLAIADAYSKMRAVDSAQADAVFKPIFEAHGWDLSNGGGDAIVQAAAVAKQDPPAAAPAGPRPGESADAYIGRDQAAPKPTPPQDEDAALAELEAAQKESDLSLAKPDAPPESLPQDVPTPAQMVAPPPKRAAPVAPRPQETAPEGLVAGRPPPDLETAPASRAPAEGMTLTDRSSGKRMASYGPQGDSVMQQRLQQDAGSLASSFPEKYRPMAKAWLGGLVLDGTVRTPEELLERQKLLMKYLESGMGAEAALAAARAKQAGGRAEVLDYEPGRKSVIEAVSRPGQKEAFEQWPTFNTVEKLLTEGEGGVATAAAVRFAAKLMNSGVLSDQDAEAPLGFGTIVQKVQRAFSKGVDADLDPEEKESLLDFVRLKKQTILAEAEQSYHGQVDAALEASTMPGSSAYAKGKAFGIQSVFGKMPFYKQKDVDRISGKRSGRGSSGPSASDKEMDALVAGVK